MNGPVPARLLERIPIPLKRWSTVKHKKDIAICYFCLVEKITKPSTVQLFALQLAYPIQTQIHMLVGVTTVLPLSEAVPLT